MRVVMATVGTRGDVQPMLALAQALVARGHSALVACPESFGDWVRAHGVEHAALGEDLQAQLEQRAGLGLPPIASFTRHLFSELQNVIAADPEVLPPDPAWGERYPYIGFAFLADDLPLGAALEAWLGAGEPPVYVGFGSMTFGARARTAAAVRGAIERVGRRCVVSGLIARTLEQAGPLPEHMFVARDVPHAALLPRCAAVVHHGGAGTMAAALRAGAPQVILPVMLDQSFHAHHMVRAGLAAKAPKLANLTEAKLERALRDALALPAQPRAAIAQRLQQSDAGTSFIAHLERAVEAAR